MVIVPIKWVELAVAFQGTANSSTNRRQNNIDLCFISFKRWKRKRRATIRDLHLPLGYRQVTLLPASVDMIHA